MFHPSTLQHGGTEPVWVINPIIHSIQMENISHLKVPGRHPNIQVLLEMFDCLILSSRFGLTNAIVSVKNIKKDEEILCNYGYYLETAPAWYIELHKRQQAPYMSSKHPS